MTKDSSLPAQISVAKAPDSQLETTPQAKPIPYWTVLAFILSRLYLVLIPFGIVPYRYGPDMVGDLKQYTAWANVMAYHYPIGDPMWQYPPLAGWVFMVGRHLVADPYIAFMALFALCDIAIFIALMIRGFRSPAASFTLGGLAGARYYVVGGLVIGPTLVTRFDVVPSVLAVLALLALARPIRSGFLMGVGALLKLWPALLVVALPRRQFGKGAAAMIATGVAGLAILAVHGPGLFSFATEQSSRGMQVESVGGLGYLLQAFVTGTRATVRFRYGALEIDSPAAATIASAIFFAGIAIIGLVVFARLRGWLDSVHAEDIALTAVLVSIATSRVFSPQYMIWAVAVAAVCLLSTKSRMRPVAVLILITAAFGQVIYPLIYASMLEGAWFATAAQTVRITALLAATGWALWLIFSPYVQRRMFSGSSELMQPCAP